MFDLDKDQRAKLEAWSEEQDRSPKVMRRHGYPYYGAIGGALTYSFTPTSLGIVVKVKHAVTDAEIDLTDYDSW